MYDDIERHMVDAGVAEPFAESKWMDKEGNVVDDEMDSFGMKV